MKKIPFISLCVAAVILSSQSIYAQVTVKKRIVTDTISLPTPKETADSSRKSNTLAIMGNLIIPGMGDLYLGNFSRSLYYFASEATLLFGSIFCWQHSSSLFETSRGYAWRYAGTRCNKNKDNEYWRIIGNEHFMDYKQYNTVMELDRLFDKKIVGEDEQWAWQHENFQAEYRQLRKNATHFQEASSFFIGGMIVERIIAFIDIRMRLRFASFINKDKDQAGVNHIEPIISFSDRKFGLTVYHTF